MLPMVVVWIIIAAVTLVIDVVTSAFIFIWFTIGAIGALVAALLGYSTFTQIASFLVLSLIFMFFGYPMAKKTIKDTVKKTPTTEQGYIGREIIVDEDIIEKSTIKIDGIYWTVRNEGEPIKKGDRVVLSGIEGNKILIKKI